MSLLEKTLDDYCSIFLKLLFNKKSSDLPCLVQAFSFSVESGKPATVFPEPKIFHRGIIGSQFILSVRFCKRRGSDRSIGLVGSIGWRVLVVLTSSRN